MDVSLEVSLILLLSLFDLTICSHLSVVEGTDSDMNDSSMAMDGVIGNLKGFSYLVVVVYIQGSFFGIDATIVIAVLVLEVTKRKGIYVVLGIILIITRTTVIWYNILPGHGDEIGIVRIFLLTTDHHFIFIEDDAP